MSSPVFDAVAVFSAARPVIEVPLVPSPPPVSSTTTPSSAPPAPPKEEELSEAAKLFAAVSSEYVASDLSADQLSYVRDNSTAVVMLDSLCSFMGPRFTYEIGKAMRDPNKFSALTTWLRNSSQFVTSIAETLDNSARVQNEVYRPVRSVITAQMYNRKLTQNQTSGALNIYSYAVDPAAPWTMDGPYTTLSVDEDVSLRATFKVGGITRVVTGHQNRAMAMAHHQNYLPKATSTKIMTDIEYRKAFSALTLGKVPGLMTDVAWVMLARLCSESSAATNSRHISLPQYKEFALSPDIVQFMTLSAKNLSLTADWYHEYSQLDYAQLPMIFDFTQGDLNAARNVRRSDDIKDLGKEPYDLYSLRFTGVSTIKKYLKPITDIQQEVCGAIAVGHSKKNNWETMLTKSGIALWKEDVRGLKSNHVLNSPVWLPVDQPPGKTFGVNLIELTKTFPPSEGKKKDRRLLISDVYIEQSNMKAEARAQAVFEYAIHLRGLCDSKWIVLAKFIPEKTIIAGKMMWDWEMIMPLFLGYHHRFYATGRMHNGELLVMLAKSSFNGSAELTEQLVIEMSKKMQTRMYFGNHLRNYFLAWGIYALPKVSPWSVLAATFATDDMKREWSRLAGTVMPATSHVPNKEQAAELINIQLKKKEKKTVSKEEEERQALSHNARKIIDAATQGKVRTTGLTKILPS